MRNILFEQSNKQCYMHIIRNNLKKMIGRVNFHSITGGCFKVAELGYRMGEEFQGQGFATKAVDLAIKLGLSQYGFNKIKAGPSTLNYGSQKVLEKNGFSLIGKEERVINVKGEWLDGLLYEK